MSRCLVERGVEHLVLERREVGDTWATQRWDSFRLNTPAWMNRLLGELPDGAFPGRDEVVARLQGVAAGLPVQAHSPVLSVRKQGDGFAVRTPDREHVAEAVVVASGGLNVPRTPALAGVLPSWMVQLHGADYRSAAELPEGAVLVVGSGQSGSQVAEDLVLAGRRVLLSTSRVGRYRWSYRGRELLGWLVDAGYWAQRPGTCRTVRCCTCRSPSSAPAVTASGCRLWPGPASSCSVGSAPSTARCCRSTRRSRSMWRTAMRWPRGSKRWRTPTSRPRSSTPRTPNRTRSRARVGRRAGTVDLIREEVRTVIWCTGFTGDLSWLELPVVDEAGAPVHRDGATSVPGLRFLGLPWLTCRSPGSCTACRTMRCAPLMRWSPGDAASKGTPHRPIRGETDQHTGPPPLTRPRALVTSAT
jgi:putative flavoprotein involved in K+ transport